MDSPMPPRPITPTVVDIDFSILSELIKNEAELAEAKQNKIQLQGNNQKNGNELQPLQQPPSASLRKRILEKIRMACPHKPLSLYLQPCLQCQRFCNCDLTTKYPDVLVNSLDGQTVRLNSVVVRGSITLQRIVKEQQNKQKIEQSTKPMSESFETLILNDTKEKDLCIGSDNQGSKFGKETIVFDQNAELLDLRDETKSNTPTLGFTAKVLMMIEKYMSLHLEQVDMVVAKEYRDRAYFTSTLFPRPPKAPVNHFAFEDWEEEFFTINPTTMLDIMQIQPELRIWDLHFAVEKWIYLYKGRPDVDEFGTGYYLEGLEENDSGCGLEDFVHKKVRNFRKKGKHNKPYKYYTKGHQYIFPRKLLQGGRSHWLYRSN